MFHHLLVGTIIFGAFVYGRSPAPVQKCLEGQMRSHPLSDKLYKKCIDGRFSTRFCPIGETFNDKSGHCIQRKPEVICTEEGKIRPADICSAYLTCANGQWLKSFCPPFHLFDQESQQCVWYYEYECPVESDQCYEGDMKGLECRSFLKCTGGKFVIQSCALGEIFDEESKSCVRGHCNRRNRREVPTCNEGYKRRLEGSCQKYTECVDGVEIERACSDCTNFDDVSRTCKIVFGHACPSPAPPVPTEPTTTTTTTPKPTTTSTTTTTPIPTTTSTTTTTPKPTTTSTTPEPTTTSTTPEPTTTSTTPEPTTTSTTSGTTQSPTTPTTPATPVSTTPTTSTNTPTRVTIAPDTGLPTSANLFSSTPYICYDGETLSILNDCKRYIVCTNGHYKVEKCGWLQYFDSVELKCMYYGYKCA